jgi:hypothetical protein
MQTRVRVRNGREVLEARKHGTPCEVERAAALHAALGRDPGASGWEATAQASAARVLDAFVREVATTEGPGGLFEQVLASQPRLRGAVERIRRQRSAMAEAIQQILGALDSTESLGMDVPARRPAAQLFAQARVAQAAMDELVADAWRSDLGNGD